MIYYKKITTLMEKILQNGSRFIILVVLLTYILWMWSDFEHKI